MEYLVESALLTHGLKSVSNETIKKESLVLCQDLAQNKMRSSAN